jgi:tetratricopeptide (TPR) repeat protein
LVPNHECTVFRLPNGTLKESGTAEFIDYASGRAWQLAVPASLAQPAPLPRSQTHGAEALDVHSNVFGNLPQLPPSYVERPALQRTLLERLRDRNHPIVTLHGHGGVGKTLLAIRAAHELAQETHWTFDFIVWFSARDIDLRNSGPCVVQPAVVNLETVSHAYARLFHAGDSPEAFASVLQSSAEHTDRGILFVFDNFESLESPRSLHSFLDTHTHLPNKVLITSRERAFKADYPIEVAGMEFEEASALIRASARELDVDALFTDQVIRSVYDYCEGHAYVMRLIVGEAAKEGKYVPPQHVLPRRFDIVASVFERSFGKLSEAGRHLFLTVANWRSAVSELALLVVLGQRGLDVESGIDECRRLSLVAEREMEDGSYCYYAPQLARVFAKKKLDGEPDRLIMLEDLGILRQFGVLGLPASDGQVPEEQVSRFVQWCAREAQARPESAEKIDHLLTYLAELCPTAWFNVAQFRMDRGASREMVEYALRRACEENPFRKDAWLLRADYAKQLGDEGTRVSSLVSAVEADPGDVELVREAALQLCRYVDRRTAEIPEGLRGVYLASLREHMVRVASKLDATGLSRLSWLFLLEGNSDTALKYARDGNAKDPNNEYCIKLLERLEPHS